MTVMRVDIWCCRYLGMSRLVYGQYLQVGVWLGCLGLGGELRWGVYGEGNEIAMFVSGSLG